MSSTRLLDIGKLPSGYTRLDLELLSFDDLPLGGEWTTRRRTVSESEIALFSGVAGDFSPLTIEASAGQPRLAPPALLVAVALGLGSIDMPVPSVAEWEWLNWKFPRPVHAGDTIYARWTLTQKRPPVGAAATSIVVWRVDVHTADGALCAEGEVGAKVHRRLGATDRHRPAEPLEQDAAATATASAPRRRRRRRTGSGNGAVADAPAVVLPAALTPKPAKPTAASGRAPGTPAARRRRRRRPSGTTPGPRDGAEPAPTSSQPAASEPPASDPAPVSAGSAPTERGTLSRVIRRLRRT